MLRMPDLVDSTWRSGRNTPKMARKSDEKEERFFEVRHISTIGGFNNKKIEF